jgi:hemoglobin
MAYAKLARLPGLKFLRTLWVCDVSVVRSSTSAPSPHDQLFKAAHRELEIHRQFDAVAGELAEALDYFKVPAREKDEVLAAFAAHKGEVTEGSLSKVG